jgi:hypothetical protein
MRLNFSNSFDKEEYINYFEGLSEEHMKFASELVN